MIMMIGEIMENPWDIQSIYDLQYFICPSCDFREHSKQEFIDHVYDIHPDFVEYLKNVQDNSLADIIFPNIKDEFKNELIVEESSIDPLKLENHDLKLCLYKSDMKISTDENQITIKEEPVTEKNNKYSFTAEETKNHKCKFCNITFVKIHILLEHIETVHEDKKENQFNHCYVALGRKVNLKNHIKVRNIHGGQKGHKCKICGKKIGTLGNLKQHIKLVHEGQKQHKCESCDKAFGHIGHLNGKLY